MCEDSVVCKWQRAIIASCEKSLGRSLTLEELKFVRSRAGYLALEMVQDHVASLAEYPDELAGYLNSENPSFTVARHSGVP
jgi:hypothetical protein